MKSEFDIISDEGLFEMVKQNLNLIRALVDEAQKLTVNMGFIEHHGEIRVKVAEIRPLIKEMEERFLNNNGCGKEFEYDDGMPMSCGTIWNDRQFFL